MLHKYAAEGCLTQIGHLPQSILSSQMLLALLIQPPYLKIDSSKGNRCDQPCACPISFSLLKAALGSGADKGGGALGHLILLFLNNYYKIKKLP